MLKGKAVEVAANSSSPTSRGTSAVAADIGGRFVRSDDTQAMGKLMGLVNCAGIAIGQKTVGKDRPHRLADFAHVIGIKLVGTCNLIHLAVDAMAKNAPELTGERVEPVHLRGHHPHPPRAGTQADRHQVADRARMPDLESQTSLTKRP